MHMFKAYLQHRFNPLHIYCRMCDYGLPVRVAHRLSTAYERLYRVFGTKHC